MWKVLRNQTRHVFITRMHRISLSLTLSLKSISHFFPILQVTHLHFQHQIHAPHPHTRSIFHSLTLYTLPCSKSTSLTTLSYTLLPSHVSTSLYLHNKHIITPSLTLPSFHSFSLSLSINTSQAHSFAVSQHIGRQVLLQPLISLSHTNWDELKPKW